MILGSAFIEEVLTKKINVLASPTRQYTEGTNKRQKDAKKNIVTVSFLANKLQAEMHFISWPWKVGRSPGISALYNEHR